MSLRDDPELAALFEDLDAVLDDRPLEPLRPPTTTARPWWPWAGGGVTVAIVVWLAWPGDAPVTSLAAPIGVPQGAPAQVLSSEPPAAPAVAAPAPLPVGPTAPGPVPPLVGAASPAATPVSAIAAPQSTGAAQAPIPSAAVPPDAAPAPGGTLADEERLFRPAEQALETGAWDVALQAAEAYLLAYPHGRWVDKVWLLQLDALVGAGRWAEAAAFAGELAERPRLATRRDDLLRIRGEALAATGDCAGALRIADGLPRAGAAVIRRACR